jgi:hypothetical protein
VSRSLASPRRGLVFGLLLAACLAGIGAALLAGIRSSATGGAVSAQARDVLPAAHAAHRPMLLYRSLTHGGQVAITPLGAAGASTAETLAPLTCDRVAYAAGRGICLSRKAGFAAGYRVAVFGADLRIRHSMGVAGIPSRARVSPDGRYGSVTLFVAGHAYAAAGTFATQTTLIDLAAGRRIATLEDFTVYDGSHQVTAVDVNFWGVTFARDSDVFYATLATGGKTYLIRGSVRRRVARVIHENVECPSLSPDGTRIAYKKRTGSSKVPWHLTILDLETMRETSLSEPRSVDDQVEWLDGTHVLYGTGGAVWEAAADGSGRPRRSLAHADSPSVVREAPAGARNPPAAPLVK